MSTKEGLRRPDSLQDAHMHECTSTESVVQMQMHSTTHTTVKHFYLLHFLNQQLSVVLTFPIATDVDRRFDVYI